MTSLTQGSTTSDANTAIILLSRGAAYANGATELTVLADRLHATLTEQGRPPLLVQPAFVDRSQPALPEALDLCAKAQTIIIAPVMVPDEPSLRRWLHNAAPHTRAHGADALAQRTSPRGRSPSGRRLQRQAHRAESRHLPRYAPAHRPDTVFAAVARQRQCAGNAHLPYPVFDGPASA